MCTLCSNFGVPNANAFAQTRQVLHQSQYAFVTKKLSLTAAQWIYLKFFGPAKLASMMINIWKVLVETMINITTSPGQGWKILTTSCTLVLLLSIIILRFCTLFYSHTSTPFVAIIITPFWYCHMPHHASLWTMDLFLILFSVSTIYYVVTVKEWFRFSRFNTIWQPY